MPPNTGDVAGVAARNNAAWCAVVGRHNAVESHVANGVWRAHGVMPTGYPEAVTLERGIVRADVLEALPAGARSIKDSFADLDLSRDGFHVLFDASWIALDTAGATAAARSGEHLRLERVRSPAALQEWASAHGNRAAFTSGLLDEPAVAILAARSSDAVTGGAILNDGEGVVGVSNVFGPAASVYRAAIAEARARFPGRPVVGWEPDDGLAAPLAAGFGIVGALRVWVR
ncbi:hypothetical protein J7E25_17100 [Agromyces sp. ISL-38]|uniref:hypothetical protein n=1 Tax=Agromyces sp. ISL-38 TaxID=2819107 RepID=UPI001BE65D86|nr:hypothetical protein [Agromyces sp. ISL-38]MBT2500816.1 hypothetical protein [Agromyces sp. ISL-38]MBT2519123.1 hypothetical protein [Streptomyces sp. ISL-90]